MRTLFVNKTIIIITTSITVFAAATMFCIWFFGSTGFFSATAVFQRKFGFRLPELAEIVNYDYSNSFFGEERLRMKISFFEDDYDQIKEGMSSYFKNFGLQQVENDKLPNFHNTCSWWDMNINEIITVGQSMRRGKRAMSISEYAFITRNEEGQHFLYIKY